MAQRIGPAGSIRVAVKGTFGGQAIVNVFWASITSSGTVTQADLDTWTLAFGTAFKTRYSASINSNYTFSNVSSTYFVDGTPLNIMQSSQNLSGAATGGSDEIAGLAAVVSRTGRAYWRGAKPRTDIPAPPTGVPGSGPAAR